MTGIALDGWLPDPEATFFPQGARDKRSFICPATAASRHPGLIAGHRYIFKKSTPRYPEEFWSEILAARIGATLGVAVPPALPAWHEGLRECGALIEFFHGKPDDPPDIAFEHGYDLCVKLRPAFDRKRGNAHSIQLLIEVCEDLSESGLVDEFPSYWACVFLFDAIIGNSDRHQDNWGVLKWRDRETGAPICRFAPAYDNGASLGREILEEAFSTWESTLYDSYIARGTHHLRWDDQDKRKCGHAELIARWLDRFPECKEPLARRLSMFTAPGFSDLCALRMPNFVPPLTKSRSDFVLELLRRRCDKLAAQYVPRPSRPAP